MTDTEMGADAFRRKVDAALPKRDFLVYVGDEPDATGWKPVYANDRREAAAFAAADAGAGEWTVWVSLGEMRHPTGVPMAVEKFRVTVPKRGA